MRAPTVKIARRELDKKCFHICESGFQVMPPAHYNAWQSVTDENAVMIDENVYCTKNWYDRYVGKK